MMVISLREMTTSTFTATDAYLNALYFFFITLEFFTKFLSNVRNRLKDKPDLEKKQHVIVHALTNHCTNI